MRTLTKELHQQKWMLLGGCLAGLVFPAIEYWILHRHVGEPYEGNSGAYVVYFAGALFGILLAMVAAYPDARKGMRDFLLTKPLDCSRIFVTKILVAAVTLPLALTIVIAPDLISTFGRSEHFAWAWAVLSVTCPLAVMLFSLTVLLVVITQDQGKSLILAIWAAVLLYFLPTMVNGFEWLNVLKHIDNPSQSLLLHLLGPRFEALVPLVQTASYGRQAPPPFVWRQMLPYLAFVGAMAAGTVAFTWLAIAAMKKRWQWQPNHKTVVWAVGLASLFIFAQIVFHVGYNLRPVTEVAGRNIQNPVSFSAEQILATLGRDLPKDRKLTGYFQSQWGALCTSDDLAVFMIYAHEPVKDPNSGQPAYLQRLILCIYRFPYTDGSQTLSAGGMDSPIGVIELPISPQLLTGKDVSKAFGGYVKDGWLYVCYQPLSPDPRYKHNSQRLTTRLVAVNIANPSAPTLGSDVVITQADHNIYYRGFAVKGDYCYIHAGDNLAIVSLETPGKPRLVKEVPWASLTPMYKQTRLSFGAFIERFTVTGDTLMASTEIHLAAFDISEPEDPRTLFFEDIQNLGVPRPQNTHSVILHNGNYSYISTYDGLIVIRAVKNASGTYSLERAGGRRATPLEKFAGRKPQQLFFYSGYLVEAAGGFGLLVYDISDPAHPKRLYHANTGGTTVGIWNDLLYTQGNNFMTFFSLPKAP